MKKAAAALFILIAALAAVMAVNAIPRIRTLGLIVLINAWLNCLRRAGTSSWSTIRAKRKQRRRRDAL
jgi:hypothetical protein